MVQLQHHKDGGIERCTLHKSAPLNRTILTAVFVVIYAYTASEMYATMGLPRQEAILQQEALRIKVLEELAQEQTELVGSGGLAAETGGDELEQEEAEGGEVVWQTAELVDHTEDDSLVEDADERPLPSVYLPSAFSCCLLFMAMTLHSLFYLGCHWSVKFTARALYIDAAEAEEGAYVQVQPKEHRGKAAMVRLSRSVRTGRLTFEFQRQKFEYYEYHELRRLKQKGEEVEELEGGDPENGAVRLIGCPVGEQLAFYIDSKGLKKQEEVDSRKDHFGENRLAIKQPTFVELMVDQLLSPIAVFQVFCSVLWLLDAYWQYTVFTVFSIVMLESTSAFQRLKTLQQLSGMSSKPYMVKVYRMGKWHDMLTEELLPGDLVSLKGNRVSKAVAKPGGGGGGEGTPTPPPQNPHPPPPHRAHNHRWQRLVPILCPATASY
jgi:hypothetical protein